MKNLIYKKGSYTEWLLPEKLYHGTTDRYIDDILEEGLKISHEKKNSALSLPLIYMTSSIEMAKNFAESVTHRKGGNPIILEIESEKLESDCIGFDWNISLRLSSQCVTYQKNILVTNIITDLKNIKQAQMLFEEPENLKIPVVWNLKESQTISHLEKIGCLFSSINKLKIKQK